MESVLQPFDLGPFRVSPDGVLAPRVEGTRPAFTFRWRNRRFDATLHRRTLTIAAAIAGLPFAADGGARGPVLAALAAAREALEPGWRLRLPPGARITLEADADLGRPPTAVQLVTASARFAWQVSPYLDLLEQAGATAP
jgi:hypothetical protein